MFVLVQDLVKKITRVSKLECLVDFVDFGAPVCLLSQSPTLAACPVAACNRANGVTALRAHPHYISINFTWACDEPDYY